MDQQKRKRGVIKISIFITSIFVVFLSISYAFINQTLLGTKKQVVTAGKLQLNLVEGNSITLSNALPIYDELGMMQESFDFELKNPTSIDIQYKIKLVDETVGEKLDLNVIKCGLTKGKNKPVIRLLSSLKEDVLDKGFVAKKTTYTYSLRLWIDSSVEEESLIKNKSRSFKLVVEASQKIQYATIQARSGSTSEEAFWGYAPSITSIVFENKINVPKDVVESWEMGVNNPKSIQAYIEEDGSLSDGTPAYKLHIQGEGKVSANRNSRYFFKGFSNLTAIEGLEYFDTSSVAEMTGMFSEDSSLETLDLSSFDTSSVENMSQVFSKCSNLRSLNLNGFDTSKLRYASSMFLDCSSLLTLDLSHFDTIRVEDMTQLFSGCSSLTDIDISNFDTSSVTKMSSMFRGCSSLTNIDVSSFDTSKVTKMSQLFSGCSSLASLDLTNFDTSKVDDMSGMFSNCSTLVRLDLNHFDTSNVINMSSMFSNCTNLTNLGIDHFNTSKVKNMRTTFSNCSSLTTLDLSHFDTSNVENMVNMFTGDGNLRVLDISSFDVSKVTASTNLFSGLPLDCSVFVKDELMKSWVSEQHKYLTNVNVKTVS